MKKIGEIKVLEDDIDNIVFNIVKVDKIIYGPEETKVIFKKDKIIFKKWFLLVVKLFYKYIDI